MAGVVQGWVTNDPDGDWPIVSGHLSNQVDSYRRMMVQGTDRPVPRPIDPDRLRASEPKGALSYFAYGTPAEMADWVRGHTAGVLVETAYFWASLSGMPEHVVAEFVRVVCTELAPLLASYDPMAGWSATEIR